MSDQYPPCLNPSCKSYGHSHPNCKCYAGMAEGGEVQHCAGPHKEDCEYYMADGGQVADNNMLSPDQVGAVKLKHGIKTGIINSDHDIGNAMLGNHSHHYAVSSALAHIGAKNLLDDNAKGAMDDHVNGLKAVNQNRLHARANKFLTNVGQDKAQAPYNDHVKKILNRPISNAETDIATPAVLKVLSSGNPQGLTQVLDHVTNIHKGHQKINESIDSLFSNEKKEPLDFKISEKNRDALKEFVKNGQLEKEMQSQLVSNPDNKNILEGTSALATHYPEQSMLLGAAKARINNYLNNLRPNPIPQKLAFDPAPNQEETEKNYNNVVDLANHPLTIFSKIQNGTILPSDVQHFKNLYPELHDYLSHQITKKVLYSQMESKMPSYSVRQGLSLFLGAPLDSTMTPQGIQAAMFVPPAGPNAQAGAQKARGRPSSPALSKMASAYRTPGQEAESRKSEK